MQECENDRVVDSASYQVLTKLVFSSFKCLFINSNHCLLILLPIFNLLLTVTCLKSCSVMFSSYAPIVNACNFAKVEVCISGREL